MMSEAASTKLLIPSTNATLDNAARHAPFTPSLKFPRAVRIFAVLEIILAILLIVWQTSAIVLAQINRISSNFDCVPLLASVVAFVASGFGISSVMRPKSRCRSASHLVLSVVCCLTSLAAFASFAMWGVFIAIDRDHLRVKGSRGPESLVIVNAAGVLTSALMCLCYILSSAMLCCTVCNDYESQEL